MARDPFEEWWEEQHLERVNRPAPMTDKEWAMLLSIMKRMCRESWETALRSLLKN